MHQRRSDPSCSSKNVQEGVNASRGTSIKTLDGEAILERIKSVDVKSAHISVYRQQLHLKRQEEGKTFTHWVTRPEGKQRCLE